VTTSTHAPDTSPPAAAPPALEVRDLAVSLKTPSGSGLIVESLTFRVDAGEAMGLVGESGSGKSMSALAIMRLLPPVATTAGGEVVVEGTEVLSLPERAMRRVRAAQIGIVFQQARSSLNPLMRVGDQMERVLRAHDRALGRNQRRERTVQLLSEVGLPSRVARSYPHQLSGGMAQRALIATVLAARPKILIADEPTTGLDVTTEAEIYDLLSKLRADLDLCLLLITHDLAIVAEHCDRVGVMHAGHLVEIGDVAQIFEQPLHPYTRALLAAIPRHDGTTDPGPDLPGQAPRLRDMPARGCRFIERCPQRMPKCAEAVSMVETAPGHDVLCRLYD
jgi:oligopeptide/dipeptide ABC transporter ATP-binding protein